MSILPMCPNCPHATTAHGPDGCGLQICNCRTTFQQIADTSPKGLPDGAAVVNRPVIGPDPFEESPGVQKLMRKAWLKGFWTACKDVNASEWDCPYAKEEDDESGH